MEGLEVQNRGIIYIPISIKHRVSCCHLSVFLGLFIVNGNEILYSQETHITFWCPMRFNNFPLDKQVCKFKVECTVRLKLLINKHLFRLGVMLMMTQKWHSLPLCCPMMTHWEILFWIILSGIFSKMTITDTTILQVASTETWRFIFWVDLH